MNGLLSRLRSASWKGGLHRHMHAAQSASDGRPRRAGQAAPDCNIAGLQTIKLQQLHPHATVATVEALATLQSLRTLDMP